MRQGCEKALGDAEFYKGQNLEERSKSRAFLFAQAAADLSGETVEAELARGAGEKPAPDWYYSYPER